MILLNSKNHIIAEGEDEVLNALRGFAIIDNLMTSQGDQFFIVYDEEGDELSVEQDEVQALQGALRSWGILVVEWEGWARREKGARNLDPWVFLPGASEKADLSTLDDGFHYRKVNN